MRIHQQARENSDIAHSIHEEAPAFANPCDQQTGDRGSGHARAV